MTIQPSPSPETKSAMPDIAYAFDDFMRPFEAFKATNDRRLDEIERRSSDVLTEEKLSRIDDALDQTRKRVDELALKGRRPVMAGEGRLPQGAGQDHKKAFDLYVRSGEAMGLRRL